MSPPMASCRLARSYPNSREIPGQSLCGKGGIGPVGTRREALDQESANLRRSASTAPPEPLTTPLWAAPATLKKETSGSPKTRPERPNTQRLPGRAEPRGTYTHEESLCLFGDQLLAETEDEVTSLLGSALRQDGRPDSNAWTLGPSETG